MNTSKKKFVFLPLGGSGEIGMNMNLYGYGVENDYKWIIVDVGVTFPDDSLPGVDLIMPDPSFIVENKNNLLGIILTHAHEDHVGAIAHIWPKLECPIFATSFTATVARSKFLEKGIEIDKYLKTVNQGSSFDLNPFKIDFVTLTHSIPEPNGVLIKTNLGSVFHTGDWKVDPDPLVGDKMDEKALKKIGDDGVLALVCDSTNVMMPGHSGSEGDLRGKLTKLFKQQDNKIFVGCFASNVARLETIFFAAKANGRKVVPVGRSIKRMITFSQENGYLDIANDLISEKESKMFQKNQLLFLCTGSQAEPRGAISRISRGENKLVKFEENDTAIFSSRIIPGNEKKLIGLFNKLVELNVNIITEKDDFVHVSGHPHQSDLIKMYDLIRPPVVIPVHGEHLHIKRHAEFAIRNKIKESLQVRNGDLIELAPNKVSIVDEVLSGRLYLDGKFLLDSNNDALSERKKISFSGIINISLILSKKEKLATKPLISVSGLPSLNGSLGDFVDEVEDEIFNYLMVKNKRILSNRKNCIGEVSRIVKRISQERLGKKPIVKIIFGNL